MNDTPKELQYRDTYTVKRFWYNGRPLKRVEYPDGSFYWCDLNHDEEYTSYRMKKSRRTVSN